MKFEVTAPGGRDRAQGPREPEPRRHGLSRRRPTAGSRPRALRMQPPRAHYRSGEFAGQSRYRHKIQRRWKNHGRPPPQRISMMVILVTYSSVASKSRRNSSRSALPPSDGNRTPGAGVSFPAPGGSRMAWSDQGPEDGRHPRFPPGHRPVRFGTAHDPGAPPRPARGAEKDIPILWTAPAPFALAIDRRKTSGHEKPGTLLSPPNGTAFRARGFTDRPSLHTLIRRSPQPTRNTVPSPGSTPKSRKTALASRMVNTHTPVPTHPGHLVPVKGGTHRARHR